MKTSPLAKFGVAFLVALGLVSATATGAQAQTHLWLVNGQNWNVATPIDALSEIGELLVLGVAINCHLQLNGTLVAADLAHAELKLKECEILNISDEICEVLDLIAKVKIKLVLLELVLIQPLVAGAIWSELKILDASEVEECPLVIVGQHETTYIMNGCLTGKVTNVNDDLVIHLTKNTHCPQGLTVGPNPAVYHDTWRLLTVTGGKVLAH